MSDLAVARRLVAEAERIVVLTGAGVSAESGVPTFRGPQGLWKSFRPEEIATPEAFRRDPRLVWEWYAWRRGLVAACRPNPGHRALAELALRAPGRTVLVTQNVDGLHHRAAHEAADAMSLDDPEPAFPLEVHGAIHRDRCSGCGRVDEEPPEVDTTDLGALPRCTACGALMRPAVVWFGEMLPAEVLEAAFSAARAADLCLLVGTSALVYPAASVPEIAVSAGGRLVEVNLEHTPLTPYADVSLRGAAGEILPELLTQLGSAPGV